LAKLKDRYDSVFIDKVANDLFSIYPSFNKSLFVKSVFSDEWEEKELKDRMKHIANSIYKVMQLPFIDVLDVLIRLAPLIDDMLLGMFIPEFISIYGQKHPNDSINAIRQTTEFTSGEFAIRIFILSDYEKSMQILLLWSKDKNKHIRRLSSEGCRPRLPWSFALNEFKKDTSYIIPILDNLKNDESLYVRTSVANNLNDISKDNPIIVLDLAKLWINKSQNTNWILKKALRSLLKEGNESALSLFGFYSPKHIDIINISLNKNVLSGKELVFSFSLCSHNLKIGKVRIEYAIHFIKANKKQNKKVFFISETNIDKKEHKVQKAFSFKKISTRKYYAGLHKLEIIINGKSLSLIEFNYLIFKGQVLNPK